MSSNLVQVPFKARCTISMFHWNETEWSTTTKSDCVLSAYLQFEKITCWDFNNHYIWKFSLLLYLRIVHIYIMLNKKNQLNLYVIVLPHNIPSIYSGTFILFFLLSVPNGLHNVKICYVTSYSCEKISGSRDFRIVLYLAFIWWDLIYSVIINLLDLNFSCLNDNVNRYQIV